MPTSEDNDDDGAITEGWDTVERFRFYTSRPIGRWLINRRRRREGRKPSRGSGTPADYGACRSAGLQMVLGRSR